MSRVRTEDLTQGESQGSSTRQEAIIRMAYLVGFGVLLCALFLNKLADNVTEVTRWGGRHSFWTRERRRREVR